MVLEPSISNIVWEPAWRVAISSMLPSEAVNDNDLNLTSLDGMSHLNVADRNAKRYQYTANAFSRIFSGPARHESRFGNGNFCILYVANSLETAISEYRHQIHVRFGAGKIHASEIFTDVFSINLVGDLHDIRGQQSKFPDCYCDDRYDGSQRLGSNLHKKSSSGIVYDSIRDIDGQCAAFFRPAVLSDAKWVKNLQFVWNGRRVTDVY